MVLVDTSVWVDHLRQGDAILASLLEAGEVSCHPFVVGELACGAIRNRSQILRLLLALPTLAKADDDEVLAFIDRHRLMGSGLGLIDVHLLASCLLAGATRLAARRGCSSALQEANERRIAKDRWRQHATVGRGGGMLARALNGAPRARR